MKLRKFRGEAPGAQFKYAAALVYIIYSLVVVAVSSDGAVIHDEVTSFLNKQPDIISKYVLIKTFSNETLTLSESHRIYARKTSAEKFNSM